MARQIAAPGLMVRSGLQVEATEIEAADPADGEAGWNTYAEDKPISGYPPLVATDRAGPFMKRVVVTPATVPPDGEGMVPLLGPSPGEVFADVVSDTGSAWPRIMRCIDLRLRDALNLSCPGGGGVADG